MFDVTVSNLASLNFAAGGASGGRIGIQGRRNGQPRSGEGENDDEFTHLESPCFLVLAGQLAADNRSL